MVARTGVRILYVLGVYHSGTTVLSNMAGQLDRFFSVGELRTVWRKLAVPGTRCGCGEPLQACPVWTRIFGSAFGDSRSQAAFGRQMWHCQREVLAETHTWRRVPSLLRRRGRELPADSALARYASGLTRLYRAIAEETGAEVIIDSSKEPTDAALLLLAPELDPAFVQIVRDPRGMVYSTLRVRASGRAVAHSRWYESAYAALGWSVGNLAGAAVRRAAGPDRSMLLRYEDFVSGPDQTMASLAALTGRPARLEASPDPRSVTMHVTHTVGGNNNRFRTGRIQLREDTEWRSHLHRLDLAAVSTLCFPLMAHYGYRLAP